MGFTKYIKSAFLYRWNLLALGAGLGFALLSGRPDVAIPLVLAGEIVYLGLLGTHPKYQQYVNAQEAKAARESGAAGGEQALDRILGLLPASAVQRFEALRARCVELRQIATELRHAGDDAPLEELQLSGLDRLLWIYLRLLFTQHMLERFFERTREADIQHDVRNLEEQLRRAAGGPEAQKQKVRKTLEDNLATCRERLANYQKARDNGELVRLEIDRLENKIRSLSELAVNRQEPDFISGQVDQVASSMIQTERTMNDLQFATGLAADEQVPELVQRQAVRARQ